VDRLPGQCTPPQSLERAPELRVLRLESHRPLEESPGLVGLAEPPRRRPRHEERRRLRGLSCERAPGEGERVRESTELQCRGAGAHRREGVGGIEGQCPLELDESIGGSAAPKAPDPDPIAAVRALDLPTALRSEVGARPPSAREAAPERAAPARRSRGGGSRPAGAPRRSWPGRPNGTWRSPS